MLPAVCVGQKMGERKDFLLEQLPRGLIDYGSKKGQTVHKQRRCTVSQKVEVTRNLKYLKDIYKNSTKIIRFLKTFCANLHPRVRGQKTFYDG